MPHGLGAVITIVVLLVTTLISVWQWRHTLTKEHSNRLIMLERWRDEMGRYIRRLRRHLMDVAEQGMNCPHCSGMIPDVIDVSQLDMSLFPPPPEPTINGNGK